MRIRWDVNEVAGREKELEAVGISIFSEDHDGYTTKKSAVSTWHFNADTAPLSAPGVRAREPDDTVGKP